MIDVKVVKNSNLDLPKYETENSAGVDIRSNVDTVIPKGERKLIPTGLFLEIPEGYEAQVRPRSGLALKHGITVLNSPGTIDSDYRGEVGVILMNHGNEDFHINKGDRIAQLVFATVIQAKFEEVLFLNETTRGKGGFGSTGKK